MIALSDPAATDALGRRIATALWSSEAGLVVGLSGELGAGKTALTRAVLGELGYDGPVVSPSYTLVEPYEFAERCFYHLDLYRLGAPEELEFLGVREIDTDRDWLFVEWAEHGQGYLPAADIVIELWYAETGRTARISAKTDRGRSFTAVFEDVA